MKRNSKQLTTKTIAHSRCGENLFTNYRKRFTLNEGSAMLSCSVWSVLPLSNQLTKTGVYFKKELIFIYEAPHNSM